MARRKVRDIYGNWVWKDDEEDKEKSESSPNTDEAKNEDEVNSSKEDRESHKVNQLPLEWRDYVAIIIASFQTILLPILIFVAVIVVFLLVFAYK